MKSQPHFSRTVGLHCSSHCDSLRVWRATGLAVAIAMALSAHATEVQAASRPFSSAWFGDKGATRPAAASPGAGSTSAGIPSLAQQQKARQQLNRSVDNLMRSANVIASQQALQASARSAAQRAGSAIPDGLISGGLKVDVNPATQGWINAKNPIQTVTGGKTTVTIEQTADKAVLNWETFNVGRNTTVDFKQDSSWAVLNRVNDPNARPSEIQGKINADGTVMIVNRNGVIFSGSSQVNVRNLTAAAATITDDQFNKGLYGVNGTATFNNAVGSVIVEQGALIATHTPQKSTTGGGYVLLLGKETHNAGEIVTNKGQTTLAAGDNFIIKKGVGTDGNPTSTTRGNEVSVSGEGLVTNRGLIRATTGDISVIGSEVRQEGVVVATTSQDVRGTVHLTSAGKVTLGKDSVTAILLENTDATAVDSQRDGMLKPAVDASDTTQNIVAGDKYRRDLSLVQISGDSVDFAAGSHTLATGGQVAVDATSRTLVRDGAVIDVSGALGVKVAMEANSIKVNIQGNELRDAPVNRDSEKGVGGGSQLNSNEVWVDARDLIYVAAGTNGYASDRWYTAGGLLEVGGYLGTQGHGVGEWMAQGGTVSFTGNEVVTQSGSHINLSGGTLDVQSGKIRQSWLRGSDGRLYEVSSAPADVRYTGVYRGYEVNHARWGVKETFYNPLIAPTSRLENGYTVGRDAGTLVVGTKNAVLEGTIAGDTFQGDRQTQAARPGLDGYNQSQTAVARGAQLVVGRYTPYYVKDSGLLRYGLTANGQTVQDVVLRAGGEKIADGLDLDTPLSPARQGTLYLDTQQLNDANLGALRIAAGNGITVEDAVTLGNGGDITLYGPQVAVNANLTSHGGTIQLGNVLSQVSSNLRVEDTVLLPASGTQAAVTVAQGAVLNTSGLWNNQRLDATNVANLPYINGGSVSVRSSRDVVLGAGSLIDVSSGAALKADGRLTGGAGGNITLAANVENVLSDGTLTLGGTLRGYGVNGGGTLTLQTGQITIGGEENGAAPGLHLAEDFFNKGFSHYQLSGQRNVTVSDGATVAVTMPVFRFGGNTQATTPSDALELWTPPLYLDDSIAGSLTQRKGASLTLHASGLPEVSPKQIQALIGKGASVTVDPGQTIAVRSGGQLTVEGTLNAWGGRIELGDLPSAAVAEFTPGLSVWIGEHAVLDVAGRATVASDALGRRYGMVDAGGAIVISSAAQSAADPADVMNRFIVVKQGARLDASGTQAELDIPGQGRTLVASDGGAITLATDDGLYLDGQLQARAGGQGASGGSLSVQSSGTSYVIDSSPQRPRQLRELIVSKKKTDADLPGDLDATTAADLLTYGHARLSVDQVQAGGFDTLTLKSGGMIAFDGDVNLSMGRALNLYAGSLGLAEGAAAGTTVALAAPYMKLAGVPFAKRDNNGLRWLVMNYGNSKNPSKQAPTGNLTLNAGRILDVADEVGMGGTLAIPDADGASSQTFDRRAFDQVKLSSDGDLRFLSAQGAGGTTLYVPGDLTLAAAQIYPGTGANASIHSGWTGGGPLDASRKLTLMRTTSDTPAVPWSVFGSLSLYAPTIDQGGVLRAPLGALTLGVGSSGGQDGSQVTLRAGSLTSVSAAGLTMPYGGTTDGVTWKYNGSTVMLKGAGSLDAGSVTLTGAFVDVQPGAVIDLSGGGELTGAGFVSGRGGSSDARYHPLVQVTDDGIVLPGLGSNPVYALMPGSQPFAAPAGGEAGAVDPLLGQQITLGAGVPGLPAGTYTLLPSTYALLPGAYRVELNGLVGQGTVPGAHALRNGSWSVNGSLSVAGTAIRDSLSRQLILTSADTLRSYSTYNEMSYAAYAAADAATRGVPRAQIEADAKLLLLDLGLGEKNAQGLSLRFLGEVQGKAAQGGRGSTLAVTAARHRIEVLSDTSLPSAEADIAVRASDLNHLNVNRLVIGGLPQVVYGQGGNLVRTELPGVNIAGKITLRSGATLAAPEVMLITQGNQYRYDGTITIEQGAVITTLGRGDVSYDSSDGFIFQPGKSSVLSVSNGMQQWLAPSAGDSGGFAGPIKVGGCVSGVCTGTTQLYSEGTIAFATDNDFQLDDKVRFGTRHLSLAVGALNIGNQQALADAATRGALTPGLVLNQQVMDRLLNGDTTVGAPALETLELIAGQSMNFFEDVTLSTVDANGKSRLKELLLTTPAIYGYGDTNDVALLKTEHLVWNGSANAPGAVAVTGAGTGAGTLQVEASRISFGYGSYGQPDGVSALNRLALGFANVNMQASDRITANNAGTLAVYQSQTGYVTGKGWQYQGGNLHLEAPLLTGEEGAVSKVTAGGAITVSAPVAGTADPKKITLEELGAEWTLTAGRDLSVDTTVALPSGKLMLAAGGNLALGEQAYLDLSGRRVTFFDDEESTRYSWGGNVILTSTAGSIHQSANSTIDLSAEHNHAGSLSATALDDSAGTVDLRGNILGATSGHYNTGGTQLPWQAARVTVKAQNLGDNLNAAFAALNDRLNLGEVYGQRSFQIKQGDLTIGDGLKANQIEVSLDGGQLTVAGTVDAAGERVGSIRLAGNNGLLLKSNAVLDAHGTLLRLDSYGKVIDAANRATVELNSGTGTLTLSDGVRIDLRHGTDDARVKAGSQRVDTIARGRLELLAPRLGADSAGDIAIDASGHYVIDGAQSITLNAVRRYHDLPYGTAPAADGKPYQQIDQDYFERPGGVHDQNTAFITAALNNGDLLNNKLAGLNNATYRQAFHLRPNVEIVTDGNLVVSGDLDLSRYRYASLNPTMPVFRAGAKPGEADYGFGEPGALTMRVGGNIALYGSINDGFTPPPATPDDNGWVLTPGVQGYGGDVVVPRAGIVLATGTRFPAGKILNYDLPMQAATLAAGTVLPVSAQLTATLTLPANTVLAGDVTLADGTQYRAGSILNQALTLPVNSTLGAGFRLPGAASLAALIWPTGVALPSLANPGSGTDVVTLAGNLTLPMGALIPSMTQVVLPEGAVSVNLRPDGVQTRNWAVAEMLPEGAQSWSMRLVAGSDTQAADSRLTRPGAEGQLLLADTHYGLYKQYEIIPGATPVVWTQDGLDYWGMQDYWADYGLSAPPKVGEAVVGVPYEGGDFCESASNCAPGPAKRVWTQYGLDYWGMQDYWADYGLSAPPKVGDVVVGVPAEGMDFCESDGLCLEIRDGDKLGELRRVYPVGQNFSVLRTGTGDLDLIAGGNVAMQSLYGIYTAGTSTASRAGSIAADFNRPRSTVADGTYLNTGNTAEVPEGENKAGPGYEALVDGKEASTYAAWYPDGGGNLLLRAGGDVTGDLLAKYNPQFADMDIREQSSSAGVGNWLWRQGTGNTANVDAIPTSWWINFGTYVPGTGKLNAAKKLGGTGESDVGAIPELVGFTGVGTLGGGNLTVQVEGDAGTLSSRGLSRNSITQPRSQGLALTVASTGRVLPDGNILLSGGGDMNVSIGGNLNPELTARATPNPNSTVTGAADYRVQRLELNGVLTNLRGDLTLLTGASGGVALQYFNAGRIEVDNRETRVFDPFTASLASATGGPALILGDATATLLTRGDLVVSGSADPGRVVLPITQSYTQAGVAKSDGNSWFSLWTDNTAINLFSAGGDVTPSVQLGLGDLIRGVDTSATDGRFVWPSQLSALAAGGSLYLGSSAIGKALLTDYNPKYSLLLAPSANAQLALLAGKSIYAGGYAVSVSTASIDAVPTPFTPAFAANLSGTQALALHNLSADAIRPDTDRFPLFTFGPNTALDIGGNGNAPVRLYALTGDIIGLDSGASLVFTYGQRTGQTWYEGAGPVWMRAGRDIVRSGSLLSETNGFPAELASTPSALVSGDGGLQTSNLYVHANATDVSIVEAGRDILYSSFNVAGPGTLEISAGRNIALVGQVATATGSSAGMPIIGESTINSLGAIVAGDLRPAADIVVQAGMGDAGVNWSNFLALYLNPANRAENGVPLADQTGKVAKTYEQELSTWLSERYGFKGTDEEALVWFNALPSAQQRIFARQLYFAEIKAGGREYNEAAGPRYGSYLRGRAAIAALFPTADKDGQPIEYAGNLLAYGGAGIHTLLGGNIQVLTPGGAQTYGVEGEVPPATAGVITQGQGNIQLYARDSILLGQSRVMTTFGGDILGWSAQGDINAGRGSRTTLVYTPPRRIYDQWGNVALSPQMPGTGAGIATLPMQDVAAGDVDLIAPLGTVDAGEAGIRVSGNVNIAALHVVNADNIQVQGEAKGLPVVMAVNTGALTNASQASSSAVQAAEQINRQSQGNRPSIISVDILGYGNERLQPAVGDAENTGYGNVSAVQVIGDGELGRDQRAKLTQSEQQRL